jgi:chitinase
MWKPHRLILITFVMLVLFCISNLSIRAQTPPAWAPNTAYQIGSMVTYNGGVYRCIQAHTSLVGWEPPIVPALWQLQTGTPLPTATRTPTGAATATRTNTPQPTPTSGGGTCTAPAWSSTAIYVNGNQVSYNGRKWQAKWWTQGDVPGGSAGVWTDLGPCSGGPTTTSQPPTFQPPTSPPGSATATRTNTPGPTSVPGSKVLLGYFVEWGVYQRNYQPKNLITSGSINKLTHINFAFGNVVNGNCVLGDTYADYDKFYDASTSVDGVADTWDAGALRGIFNQFRKLKQMYPHIKILYSFGGWTWSGGFAQAAANPTAFANSCYNLLYDPRWNGVFDGIDIDWEYPNACGLTCDSSGPQAFVNLMSALRQRFGNELVTAAVTAGISNINATNYGPASFYVDWYNVMTYDFFGTWAATGPTALHSALHAWPGMPSGQNTFYSDAAIQHYKSKGVPANKLLLGVGFYGRGWTGVPNINGGLNQSATGPAGGTYEQGNEDYKVLVNSCPATGTAGGTAYAFCNGNFWSYDTPSTLAGKMSYQKGQGMRGVFFWELTGDTANGALITALYNNR